MVFRRIDHKAFMLAKFFEAVRNFWCELSSMKPRENKVMNATFKGHKTMKDRKVFSADLSSPFNQKVPFGCDKNLQENGNIIMSGNFNGLNVFDSQIVYTKP